MINGRMLGKVLVLKRWPKDYRKERYGEVVRFYDQARTINGDVVSFRLPSQQSRLCKFLLYVGPWSRISVAPSILVVRTTPLQQGMMFTAKE